MLGQVVAIVILVSLLGMMFHVVFAHFVRVVLTLLTPWLVVSPLIYFASTRKETTRRCALIFASAIFIYVVGLFSAFVFLATWMRLVPVLSTIGIVVAILFTAGLGAGTVYFQAVQRLAMYSRNPQ